ncbi:(+)-neomenthol dehydrogenase-like [Cynara cardunculus var. scolymus]|uniref:(+)-neomenthol dehydrogenase-like n=1 Tax=Cynara cardunculus var. scolymus TaxID=59895 RepID=UPI000D6242F1|nr:(+)-neomenthol dehydrogenase-like [Cynara cardunculus var. scolymus]
MVYILGICRPQVIMASTTEKASTEKRVAIVTGGNKGIGLEICRQLALNDITVILTARNESRGVEAVEKLNVSGCVDVVFHQLDVKDPASVARLAEFVESRFKKLDILVNNAAENGIIVNYDAFRAFKDGAGYEEVYDKNAHLLTGIIEQPYNLGEECIKTNYYGAKAVTEAFLPLLQLSSSPRIVNVSSNYGELQWIHNEKVKAEFLDIDNLTEEKIDGIIQRFLKDFKANKLSENGWPLTVGAYKVSKAAMNAYTRLLARKFSNILVNCVHPGYVITDITSDTGHLTPEEGARAPVMVALLPNNSPSGVFFSRMEISSF